MSGSAARLIDRPVPARPGRGSVANGAATLRAVGGRRVLVGEAVAPVDAFWIAHCHAGVRSVDVGGRQIRFGAGDILFGDGRISPVDSILPGIGSTLWVMQPAIMQPLLACSPQPEGILRAGEPLAILAGAYLDHLAVVIDQLGSASAAPLMTNLAVMLALHQQSRRDARHAGDRRVTSIRHAIDARHGDPALSPRRMAAEHGISVRTLHALFEPTGRSFARYLLDTRLAAAHARLADDGDRERTVVDIAYASGFEALSTFYRAFRNRYGYSPAELRPKP